MDLSNFNFFFFFLQDLERMRCEINTHSLVQGHVCKIQIRILSSQMRTHQNGAGVWKQYETELCTTTFMSLVSTNYNSVFLFLSLKYGKKGNI